MTRYEMMDKISKTLKPGECIEVCVSHHGDWSGANVYEITNEGYNWIDHKWHTYGTLRDTYLELVLKK